MKFFKKPKTYKPKVKKPELRDERWIQKFLWFPVTINDETRWLEKANIKQVYLKIVEGNAQPVEKYRWVNILFYNNNYW